MTTCLVTGAAGFIGSHLCERLLADGCSVIGVDSFTDYYDVRHKWLNVAEAFRHPRFRLVSIDLMTADLYALMEGVDAVYHLAGQPGVRGSWGNSFDTYLRNNIAITQRLLEAARLRPLEALVYASSSSVYGLAAPMRETTLPRPYSPYGVTKLAAEHLCLLYAANYGVPVTAVRYFTVFGPRQRPDMAFTRFIEAALHGRPLGILGDGSQTRDFTFVDDAVAGTVAAAKYGRRGAVYNIGGGCHASLAEAVALIERTAGVTATLQFSAAQKGDVADTRADTLAARSEINFAPGVDLATGIARQVEWFTMRHAQLADELDVPASIQPLATAIG